MATVKFDQARVEMAMEMALVDSVQLLQEKILEITPRDPNRMPKDPSRHVTGNLKRSIDYQQVGKFEFIIGTKMGEAEYGKYLEFGTPNMKPRSFLRKGILDNKDLVAQNFAKRFRQVIGG